MKNLELENNWLKIIYFATGYGFVVSMLYLFGYWSTFNINILEYIKISDVIKISIYPVITSIGLSIVGFIVGDFVRRWVEEPNVQKSENLKKLENWTERISKIFIILISIFVLCYLLYMHEWSLFWPIFALIFPTVTICILVRYIPGLIKKFIPFPGFEALILWILIAIPSSAFAYGKLRSLSTLEGGNCFYINVSTFKDKELFQDQKRLKYLGLGGDFMFFLSEDNTKLYILEPSKMPVLELYKSKSQIKTETIKK